MPAWQRASGVGKSVSEKEPAPMGGSASGVDACETVWRGVDLPATGTREKRRPTTQRAGGWLA